VSWLGGWNAKLLTSLKIKALKVVDLADLVNQALHIPGCISGSYRPQGLSWGYNHDLV
jgi:hypothetical protein